MVGVLCSLSFFMGAPGLLSEPSPRSHRRPSRGGVARSGCQGRPPFAAAEGSSLTVASTSPKWRAMVAPRGWPIPLVSLSPFCFCWLFLSLLSIPHFTPKGLSYSKAGQKISTDKILIFGYDSDIAEASQA